MCILLKLVFLTYVFSKVIEEKPLGGRLDSPCKGRVNIFRESLGYGVHCTYCFTLDYIDIFYTFWIKLGKSSFLFFFYDKVESWAAKDM